MILLQQTRDFFLQVVLWKCGGAILHKYQFLRKSCFNLPDQFHQKHTDLGWGWWQCWRTLDERVHTAPTDCQSYYLPSPPEMPWTHTQKKVTLTLWCFTDFTALNELLRLRQPSRNETSTHLLMTRVDTQHIKYTNTTLYLWARGKYITIFSSHLVLFSFFSL